jgi:hypothetical protein
MKRQFTMSREDLDALAIDRAAKIVRDIFVVLQKSGHAAYVSIDGAAGAAGLLAVAHAAYKEAMIEVEMEHEVREHPPWRQPMTTSDFVAAAHEEDAAAFVSPHFLSPIPMPGQARVSRLRSVSVPSAAAARVPPPSAHLHDDGTPCECDPDCNCHPPTRNEDPIVTGERGSWHLDTCPRSPKNRGALP